MKKNFRDSNDNLINYDACDDDKIKFEVIMTRFDGRVTNIESHVQDIKTAIDALIKEQKLLNEKQSVLSNYVHQWTISIGAEVKKIPGEYGLECRLAEVEKSILSVKSGIKAMIISYPMAIALFGFIFKYFVK